MPRALRTSVVASILTALATFGAGGPDDLAAQTEIEILPRAATLTLGGRLQTQLQASTVEDEPADVFIRRARLRLDISIGDFLDGRVNPEFSGGKTTLQDAWVRMNFARSFRVSFGQFQRAFSIFEQSSSTDLPIIERDGRVAGVDVCPGVGGVCSFSRMTEKLLFDGRDTGLRLDGRLDGGVAYLVTVTNGEGINQGDINDAKSVSGRLTVDAGGFTVGAFAGLHDFDVPGEEEGETETQYGLSGGLDLEVGTWRDGFHLLAAVAYGENWVLGGDSNFTTVQALASYYVPTGDATYEGVEPLLRVAWTEPDTEVADNAGLVVTPGLMLYFIGRSGVSANIDAWIPSGDEDAEFSLKLQTYLYF